MNSAFSLASFNSTNATRPVAPSVYKTQQPSQFEKEIMAAAQWVMTTYDANKNGYLDQPEAQKLWNDVVSYDYAGQVVAQIAPIQQWIAKFDTNKDGKLTLGEVAAAIQDNSSAFSFASVAQPAYVDPTEQKLAEAAKWILTNYDANKDGTLDQPEAQKLWKDVSSYDYTGEVVAQIGDLQKWISTFDKNKDGKLTLGELILAIQDQSPIVALNS